VALDCCPTRHSFGRVGFIRLSTLNFVAFVVFSFIFVRNILKLRREREERQLGSKIKTRLLVYFISISFLPITAMAVFRTVPQPLARKMVLSIS
jgi:nitrogen fixation/metabolism regulation signal transduction histidine kinase